MMAFETESTETVLPQERGSEMLARLYQGCAKLKEEIYSPIPENQKVYDQLYAEYLRLYNYFGRGENNVMKTLKHIRDKVK